MIFAFFLPELLSSNSFSIDIVVAWFDALRHAVGAAIGVILLFTMASAVAVATWQAIYRTVLGWLGTR